ncbi:MAG: EamA family transporter [Bauldia sp.]|nr:EamA family transporter [Bauldia sp.]
MSGAALGLWSAVLFGLSTPVAKSLLGGGVSPWLLAGLLYLGSGVGLVGILALRRIRGGPRREASLRPADAPWLLAVVLSGGVAGPVLLMFGLTTLPGSSAALLLTFEGLATMAIAWLVFREPVGPRILAGAAMIVAGAALVAWSGSGGISFGALLVLAACLAWAVDNNLTRKLSAADPVQIAAVKGLAAGAVNLAIAFGSGSELPGFTTTAAALAVGLCGYGISLVLFVLALRSVGAARTGAYFSTAPFIGATFGVAFLGEPVSVTLVVGGVLIAAGVVIHVLESHEHEHAHKALEHDHRHVHDEHHGHIHGPSDPPGEPHAHWHRHEPMVHRHPHFPDIHHRHGH